MIIPGVEQQELVATKPVDFRNYAERTIMLNALAAETMCFSLSTA